MAGTYLNFPFDNDIFDYKWRQLKDTVSLALLESGAMVSDSEIENLLANGGNKFTIPFYNVLGGDEDNYDGATNITKTALTGASQSGIAYGRAHAFTAKDFIKDFNSGADPMDSIVGQVSRWYAIRKQARLVKMLNALFGLDDMASHVKNIARTTAGTVAAANKVGATTLNDAVVAALGDQAGAISLAIMHSQVANNLGNINLLEYRKYTDNAGIQREIRIADINGMIAIITDTGTSHLNTTTNETEYDTYLLGRGALLQAFVPVAHPSAVVRDEFTNGGEESLVTRKRECIHPNGFSWKGASSIISPTDTELGTSSNWELGSGVDAKLIPMVKVVSNG